MDDRYSDTQSGLIHCEHCGEDYADTYKVCPFCHTAPGAKKSGSRSASRAKHRTNTRGGGYGGARSPLSIIGIVLSVILVIAAVIIVIMLAKSALSNRTQPQAAPSASTAQKDTEDSASASSSASSSEEPESHAVLPPQAEDGADSSDDTSNQYNTPLSITLNSPYVDNVDDITLNYSESVQLTAVFTPEDAEGQVTWSSSDGAVATVDQTGMVTYVAKGTCTITASCGDVSAECTIRCRGVDSSQVQDD